MDKLPVSVRPVFARLGRRLAIGLFLDIWPTWAIASLLLAGTITVVCRIFFPVAAPVLPWLWLAPLLTALPVVVLCVKRAYRPGQVAAVADWLGGGQGILLSLLETNDPAWVESTLAAHASAFALPRFQLRRTLAMLLPAVAFLAVAMMLPQRIPSQAGNAALAQDIAADLQTALAELKQQELITPVEEQRLDEEIERIRKSAEQRVDASTWEAADALREQVVAGLSEKQQAVKWAEESLARYAAAVQAGGAGEASAGAQAAELTKALEKLAQSGLLAGAPAKLQGLLKGGKLPTDAAALRDLAAALAQHLAATNGRFAGLGQLGKEFGRFDPSQFPLDGTGSGPDGDGDPGRGGVNRGRGDAELTWGKESLPFDRFKSKPLPPGAARSPDDWAPVMSMPGAPQESAVAGVRSAARQYDAEAGQAAWRRSLAPRHQSAVKKYFDPAVKPAGPPAVKKDR
jgi:hypothetical protein